MYLAVLAELAAGAAALAVPAALFAGAMGGRRAVRHATYGVAVALAAAIVALAVSGALGGTSLAMDGTAVTTAALALAVLAAPVAAAALGRARRDRERAATRARRLELAMAADAERLRLARDLHDVVGHHLAAIAVLAQGDDDRDAGYAHEALDLAGRQAALALDEVRALVGALRAADDDADRSALPALDDLAGRARRAGARVDLQVTVSAMALPADVELAAYRVVQESLTNVLRHADPPLVRIRVGPDGDTLRVLVEDEGTTAGAGSRGRAGYGLCGMRERVEALGGTLEAGPRPGGRGWRVHAVLPSGGR